MELALDPTHKESKKLQEMIDAEGRKLARALAEAHEKEEKYAAVFKFYRRYYQLTLKKESVAAGINSSPTRDIILDFPWKDLKQDRFFCLKIWEKINH